MRRPLLSKRPTTKQICGTSTWGAELKKDLLQWPQDTGEGLPALLAEEIREAACTFPDETGLGWDGWHPNVVCRLSPELLQLLVIILLECERTGC